MANIPSPDVVFPNEYKTSCFLKNVVTAPNIFVGDYTYYDDPIDPTGFERNNVLFNWPEFGDKLVIGKFCSIASGVQFIMGSANHRLNSVSTYPFNVMGGKNSASSFTAALQGGHRRRQRCLDRAPKRHHARRHHRRRRHYRRLFRRHARRRTLYGGRRQPGPVHQKTL